MKLREPDIISVYAEGVSRADSATCGDARVELALERRGLKVQLTADETRVRFVRLRWQFTPDEAPAWPVRVYGDHWERGYGDLRWGAIDPDRVMPWVCAATNGDDIDDDTFGRVTDCYGVCVRPGAICSWQYDAAGVTLNCDVRSGGVGVHLRGRTLDVCQVRMQRIRDVSAFTALDTFYARQCRDRLMPPQPVYGFNNWYYAYGKSSHDDIMRDTRLLAELCEGNANRPFMVIDDGWAIYHTDGPWDRGNARFPDMKRLAGEIAAQGVRPGIWVRYLADSHRCSPLPREARMLRDSQYLDPSHPAVLEEVARITHQLTGWGYELIKHDFSTFDIFGDWGFRRERTITSDGWRFYDDTRTSAEITLDFYRAIKEAAGDALILGCNVIGHLAAGLVHINRVGDDTSGREWNRTRKMGPNTLAFRMLHDKNFFAADADCAPLTAAVDSEMAFRWLDILARSGTPLFVSPEPGALDAQGMDRLRAALRINSLQRDTLIPRDWMDNMTPAVYDMNGSRISVNWYDGVSAEDGAKV